ncbi:DUF5994 family protein [Dactylosporangium sp. NPDC050588]|uniref:DUF5994 family protein n=1 Tax=Dactylosporangium sp. NPDC050588 TaxID=3157211 RepID=UPI0033D0D8DB
MTDGTRNHAVRLELRAMFPTPATTLDGAWCPRSRDSAGELIALIDALDAWQAPVRLLMLNPQGRRGHPQRIDALTEASGSPGYLCSTGPS